MKLTRLFFLLVILASSAIAAHAQTPLPAPTSGGAGDPKLVFPDACPADAVCATLTQLPDMPPIVVPDCTSGETLAYCLSIGFVIDVASPISVGPSFNSLWYCAQDAPPTFDLGLALGTTNGIPGPLGQDFAPQLPGETGTFTGCEYWSGTISGTVGIAEVGGITPLIIPDGLRRRRKFYLSRASYIPAVYERTPADFSRRYRQKALWNYFPQLSGLAQTGNQHRRLSVFITLPHSFRLRHSSCPNYGLDS